MWLSYGTPEAGDNEASGLISSEAKALDVQRIVVRRRVERLHFIQQCPVGLEGDAHNPEGKTACGAVLQPYGGRVEHLY